MSEGAWGGRRKGAGRPKSEKKLESRHIRFCDAEWDLIKSKAAERKMPLREYIYRLVENDKITD